MRIILIISFFSFSAIVNAQKVKFSDLAMLSWTHTVNEVDSILNSKGFSFLSNERVEGRPKVTYSRGSSKENFEAISCMPYNKNGEQWFVIQYVAPKESFYEIKSEIDKQPHKVLRDTIMEKNYERLYNLSIYTIKFNITSGGENVGYIITMRQAIENILK